MALRKAIYRVRGNGGTLILPQYIAVIKIPDEYTVPLELASGLDKIAGIDDLLGLPQIISVGQAIKSGVIVRTRIRVQLNENSPIRTQHLYVAGAYMPDCLGNVMYKPIKVLRGGSTTPTEEKIISITVPRRRTFI